MFRTHRGKQRSLGLLKVPTREMRAVLEADYNETSTPLADCSRPVTDKSDDVVLRKTLTNSGCRLFMENAKALGF